MLLRCGVPPIGGGCVMASDTPTPEELCRASEVRDGAEVCGATFIAGWVCDLERQNCER